MYLVFFLYPIQVSFPVCVCTFLCVYYHLHWVCEHHTIEANEVLVVQGVHGVDFTDEVLQSVWLTENICLQTLHSNIQLEAKTKIQYTDSRSCFCISSTCCVGLSSANIFINMVLLLLDLFEMLPTIFPEGVNHSPLFTTPNDPSPSFSNSVRSFSGMRHVRACCCPSSRAPPQLGCVACTPSPRPNGGVGDNFRKEVVGWPCWGKSAPSGRFPLNT